MTMTITYFKDSLRIQLQKIVCFFFLTKKLRSITTISLIVWRKKKRERKAIQRQPITLCIDAFNIF